MAMVIRLALLFRRLVLLMSVSVGLATPASALIVMNLDPEQINYVPPTAATSGFADPAPVWENVTNAGVYLGDGWILTAAHKGVLSEVNFGFEQFRSIPGTRIDLTNPSGKGLTSNADLMLYRIDTAERYSGTPEELANAAGAPLAPITVATAAPTNGTELLVFGNGRVKNEPSKLLHWDRSKTSTSWPTEEVCDDCLHNAPSGQVHAIGFSATGAGRKAWGTNKVESSIVTTILANNDDTEVVAVSGVSTRAVKLSGRHTFALAFDFDEYQFTTSPTGELLGGGNEVKAAGSDSGSPVFFQQDPHDSNGDGDYEWRLGGLLHAIFNYHSAGRAIAIREDNGGGPDKAYGDITVFSDLSPYESQIAQILAQDAYSVVGDINLDGVVSGDGTGAWESDDITALLDGWGWQQETPDILSWKHGDLNQDGVTNLADAIELHRALFGSGASLEFADSPLALLGNTAVPEPTTVGLGLLLVGVGGCAWRRRAERRM